MSKDCRCYDKMWLRKDMENMGYIFEYCNKYCLELYNVTVDRLKFIDKFMSSKFRREMETGHPRMLSQAAYDSVKMFIDVDCNGDCKQFEVDKKESKLAYRQLYWIGWIYAYLHFNERVYSDLLVKALPIEFMLNEYWVGHEMSKEVYYEHIKDTLRMNIRKLEIKNGDTV